MLASAIGMDKDIQQKILRAEGLGVPEAPWSKSGVEGRPGGVIRTRLIEAFGLPLVTKPVSAKAPASA